MTTRLSTKGQIVLPKDLRAARAWGPGTEFTILETEEGVLLRPVKSFPRTRLSEVAGCLRVRGRPATDAQMRNAVMREVKRRHDGGRY